MESGERQPFWSAVTRHRFSVWPRRLGIAKRAARQVTPEKSADESAHSKGSATVPVAADHGARDARDPQNESKASARSRRKQAIFLFCFLMFCYSFIHQRMGWNQNSRLDLLHALFVHKTFKIDAYHENTGDKSIANGHYYSDKAPGIVFLALPAFAVAKATLHVLDVPLDSTKGWLASSWMTTVGSVGLITALGGVAMFLFLSRLVEQRIAFLTTFVVFLGSAPFPYATMLFSHAAVIGLICIALWAIADDDFLSRIIKNVGGTSYASPLTIGGTNSVSPNYTWMSRHILAGICCGLAISSEYTAAIAAGGVLALALLTSFKRAMILSAAAIPPLLLIPAYNSICFGGPLAFGYHHLALPEFQDMNKGVFGITFPPKVGAAYLLLLSPQRGLFFWTPFFLLAFPGIVLLFRRSSKLAWIVVAVTCTHILAICGYYMPSGGAALGPRHLAPILCFLAIPSAYGLFLFPRIGWLLGYCSLVVTGMGTLLDAMPPDSGANRILTFYLSQLQNGTSTRSLFYIANLLPHHWATFLPMAAVLWFYIAIIFKAPRQRITLRH